MPSPLLYDGILYFLKSELRRARRRSTRRPASRTTSCSGSKGAERVLFAGGAAGRIYVLGQEGTTAVLKHGPTFELLATNKLDDQLRCVAGAGRQGDVSERVQISLYCIAAQT